MKKYIVLFVLVMIFSSCKHQQETVLKTSMKSPIVLVSKDYKSTHQTWLRNSIKNDNVVCVNMYAINSIDSFKMMLKKADGIIISGGEDVNPALYGKQKELNRCGKINPHRDSLEFLLIKFAINKKIPLLGICRGHQILNVSQGGTLIIDIPKDVGSDFIHRDSRERYRNNSTSVFHKIYIEKGSYLYNIVKVDSGYAYSNHHQAVEKVANKFKVSSFASDKVAESIEPIDTLQHPFILGIQWHPEATDVKNPLSGTIARKFMNKVKQHHIID